MPPPTCKCNRPAQRRMVHKEGPNKGRWFYGCRNFGSPRACKFFQWDDTTAPANNNNNNRNPPPAVMTPMRPSQQQQQQQNQSQSPDRPLSPSARPFIPSVAQAALGVASPEHHGRMVPQSFQPRPTTGGGSAQHIGTQTPVKTSQPSSASQNQGQSQQNIFAANGAAPLNVTLCYVDAARFGVKFPYNQAFIDFLKKLPYGMKGFWDPGSKLWVFYLRNYTQLAIEFATKAPMPVVLNQIPEHILKQLGITPPVIPTTTHAGTSQVQQQHQQPPQQQQQRRQIPQAETFTDAEVESRISASIPSEIWSRLYDFQHQGVKFGVKYKGRFLLADEMGLGKTVQSLMVAVCFAQEDWPLLIICPSQMKLVWHQALLDWLPPDIAEENDIVIIKDKKSAAEQLKTSPLIVITSYDLAKDKAVLPCLKSLEAHCIICDESHQMKSLVAQRTAGISKLVRAARRAILVSGTPALSRPIELYPQVEMSQPGLLGTLKEFGRRYCDGKPARNPQWSTYGDGMDYSGASNLGELQHILESNIMIRRTKDILAHALPPKLRQRIYIPMDPQARLRVEETKSEIACLNRSVQLGLIHSAQADAERKQLLTQFYYVTGPAKVAAVARHVQGLLESDPRKKVLVFAHHLDVLNGLEEVLLGGRRGERGSQRGYKGIRIDGATTAPKRKKLVDAFQHDASLRVAVLSITAAGVGITLTAASHVVFGELYWNPGHLIQCEDRAHRMGQQAMVKVDYLLTREDSIDGLIWKTVKEKLDIVNATMGDTNGNAFRQTQVGTSATPSTLSRQQQRQQQQVKTEMKVKDEEEEVEIEEGDALLALYSREAAAAAAGAGASIDNGEALLTTVLKAESDSEGGAAPGPSNPAPNSNNNNNKTDGDTYRSPVKQEPGVGTHKAGAVVAPKTVSPGKRAASERDRDEKPAVSNGASKSSCSEGGTRRSERVRRRLNIDR